MHHLLIKTDLFSFTIFTPNQNDPLASVFKHLPLKNYININKLQKKNS